MYEEEQNLKCMAIFNLPTQKANVSDCFFEQGRSLLLGCFVAAVALVFWKQKYLLMSQVIAHWKANKSLTNSYIREKL